jgi:hypothetical protein
MPAPSSTPSPAVVAEIEPAPTEQTWLDLWHDVRRGQKERLGTFAPDDPPPPNAEAAKQALCVFACEGPGPWLIHGFTGYECWDVAFKTRGEFHRTKLGCAWLENLCVDAIQLRVIEFAVVGTSVTAHVEVDTGHWYEDPDKECPDPDEDCSICDERTERCTLTVDMASGVSNKFDCTLE